MGYRVEIQGWVQVPAAEQLVAQLGPIARDARITGISVQVTLDQYRTRDFFRGDVLDRIFESESEALAATQASYRGADTSGVGLAWAITEAQECAVCSNAGQEAAARMESTIRCPECGDAYIVALCDECAVEMRRAPDEARWCEACRGRAAMARG